MPSLPRLAPLFPTEQDQRGQLQHSSNPMAHLPVDPSRVARESDLEGRSLLQGQAVGSEAQLPDLGELLGEKAMQRLEVGGDGGG